MKRDAVERLINTFNKMAGESMEMTNDSSISPAAQKHFKGRADVFALVATTLAEWEILFPSREEES